MKQNTMTILFASTVIMALLSGCTGTEARPNNATQTGAVTGALAGSVIGYNSSIFGTANYNADYYATVIGTSDTSLIHPQ